MDVLSDALRVLRLRGALFLNAEFHEPWCVPAPGGADLARLLSPAHEQVAICHLVLEGRCWARLRGGEALSLEAGEVVAFPRGDAHFIGSGRNHAPVSPADAVDFRFPELARARYGGDGAATTLVCGWFGYEPNSGNPALAALPRVLHACVRKRASGAWLERSILYAVQEAASRQPGADVMADKLAELLFVETLRGYMEALPQREIGWLAGLRDPLVGRSLALLHERPAHGWTVASLAKAVGASRTALAERFVTLTGVPPMQYLTQWRIALAANLLEGGRLTLSRVAERVGY
jgi:AraC-like DNA-binding protein